MGAYDVVQEITGDTPGEAYAEAVEIALWDHGHSGYTGTIGESSGWAMARDLSNSVEVQPMLLDEAYDYAQTLMDETDQVQKWGPAVLIPLSEQPNTWVAVGVYSS